MHFSRQWIDDPNKSWTVNFEMKEMTSILQKQHEMNIVGQGGKIILFMLPSLCAAIFLNVNFPAIAALPTGLRWIQPIGYVLLIPGLLLWGSAVVQLLIGFPTGTLITQGAYSIVRNPIYASVTLFILPAAAILTFTWVYLVPAVFLYVGVMIFIRVEERQLLIAYGEEYKRYCANHHRLIPFINPGAQVGN